MTITKTDIRAMASLRNTYTGDDFGIAKAKSDKKREQNRMRRTLKPNAVYIDVPGGRRKRVRMINAIYDLLGHEVKVHDILSGNIYFKRSAKLVSDDKS